MEPHEEYVRVGYHGEREFQAAGNLPRQGSAGYGGYSGGYDGSGGYGSYGADGGGSFSGQNRHRRGPPIYDIGLQDYTQGEEASDGGKRTGRYSAAAHQKPASGNNNLYNNVPGRAAVGATPRPGYKKQQFYEQSDPVQDYAIRGPQAYYDPGPLGEEGGAVHGEGGGHGHPDEYGSHAGGGSNNFEEYERLVEEGHKSSIHGGGEGDGDGGGGEFNNHGLDAEDVHGVEVAAAAAVEQQIENDPRYNNDGFEHGDNDDDRHLDDSSSSSGSGGGDEGEENRHQNEDLFDPANFPFQGYGGNHGGGGGEGQDDDGFGHRPPGGDHESTGGGGHFGSQGYQNEDAPSYGSKPAEFGGGKPLYEEGGFHPSAQPPSGSYPRQESPPPPPPRYQEPQQGGQQNPPDADYERYFTLHYDYDYEPANNNNNNGNEHNSSPPASSSQEERGDDRQHGGVDEHGFEDIFADKRSVRGEKEFDRWLVFLLLCYTLLSFVCCPVPQRTGSYLIYVI